MSKKSFYVTTPIYYVNDLPHLGHAYTTVAADIIARYKRLQGYDVFFLTGTDEHGQKVEQAAKKRNVDPQKHCDEFHLRFKELWKRLNISNNDFIRTTENRHKEVVRQILQDLFDKGEIYKDSYEGWYCLPDERFWTEKDLIDGNCPECGRQVDRIKEYNYFFKMGKYQEWLKKYIESDEVLILPSNRKNEVLGFLNKDLGDLCISRPKERLKWGIPLPFDESYVTYVWFDALINYITAAGYKADEKQFNKWWPADFHLVGKDILTTHSVYWLTMLKAMEIAPPENIFAHGWWTVNGQKMSKSLLNVVEPNRLLNEYGVDAVRYFLMREVPFGLDGDFSHQAMIGRINTDLANNLGNLLNRTLNMVQRYYKGIIPNPAGVETSDNELINKAAQTVQEVEKLLDTLEFSKILVSIWGLIDSTNKYIDSSAPWNLAKSEETKERLSSVIYNTVEAIRIIAILLYPFMPDKADEIIKQIGITEDSLSQGMDSAKKWGGIKAGAFVNPGEQLFPRIDDDRKKELLKLKGENVEETKVDPKDNKNKISDSSSKPELISIDDFARLDLRVGEIKEAEKVEKSKKLIKLKVDIGTETRQVVAGIASCYTAEDLVGKKIILVANLKPAKLMGIESQGMILAANSGEKITLAGFQDEVTLGSKVK